MSISGIRSVDFVIQASGEGVINHNGTFPVFNPGAGRRVDNHLFPKLRGFDPLQRVQRERDGRTESWTLSLTDPKLGKASLMVSSACIRAGLFRDVSFGLKEVTVDNVERVLASLHGLVRGYLITGGGRNMARKSPLHVTDFECREPGLVFNQGTNANKRGTDQENTSMYSFFSTAATLHYTGKMSLSIEDLQFIPLENGLGRSACDHTISSADGHRMADTITAFLRDIAPDGIEPGARFVNAIRRGCVEPVAESGVLLDDAALRVVAAAVRTLIEGLTIRQGKGYFVVEQVRVDYNDGRIFRSVEAPDLAVDQPDQPFAAYYDAEAIDKEAHDVDQMARRRTHEMRKTSKESKRKKGAKA